MTRTCCIEDCQSDAKDERSLFRSYIFLKFEIEPYVRYIYIFYFISSYLLELLIVEEIG